MAAEIDDQSHTITSRFNEQQRFEAENKRLYVRSSIIKKPNANINNDPWKLKPIDFSVKNFHPKPHRRHELTNFIEQQPSLLDKNNKKSRDDAAVMKYFSRYLTQPSNNEKIKKFITRPRIDREPIKNITHTGKFQDAKPHDFRGYPKIEELGLSEFETNYEHDPFNIQFLSSNLRTLWSDQFDKQSSDDNKSHIQMYRVLTSKPQWDRKLILPKLIYPTPYAAYTRYRKPNRTPQSAYWSRVEETLSKQRTNKQQLHLSTINTSKDIRIE
ncbi:unnamed protein product [Didymodactylos carnosus]|uniref:Uncharacterized protein n=1 Tax=Didymodactylos carnosus TaxID=1234261 RepID=A0A814I2E2_9BILA|nr:unnamed protein product [Didymodactylos carnosus]CAF3789380.1 unnamed protein product [Didymodactylos carnosus]